MKEQEENNKLIAVFMGWEPYEKSEIAKELTWHTDKGYKPAQTIDECYGNYLWTAGTKDAWSFIDLRHVKYQENWSLLMPVVEKIERLAAVTIINKGCKIETIEEEFIEIGLTTHNAVYAAVIQFIQWYNSVNKTQE